MNKNTFRIALSVFLVLLVFAFSCNNEKADKTEKDKVAAENIDMKISSTDEANAKTDLLLDIASSMPENQWQYPYELPNLTYAYDALEPDIDAMTMEIHHSKHHQGYTNKTNAAIEENSLKEIPLLQLFAHIDKYPAAVRNNSGGFYNHSLYWTFLTPGGSEFKGEVADAIKAEFGSFEDFKKEFEKAAATQFGSGWAWLVMTPENKLAVTQTANQDNPLMNTEELIGIPLLNVDVWEHAYYLKYQNKRTEYLSNFWNIVNWEAVNNRYLEAESLLGSD